MSQVLLLGLVGNMGIYYAGFMQGFYSLLPTYEPVSFVGGFHDGFWALFLNRLSGEWSKNSKCRVLADKLKHVSISFPTKRHFLMLFL